MQAPQRLGKYQVRHEIGRGAMAVVYEAYDTAIGRTVALKVLLDGASGDSVSEEVRARFRREAQIAGQLHHPNIVAVLDVGDFDSDLDARPRPCIVMEFVAGRDLKALLAAELRFSLADAVRILDELLAGLQYAHERGVIHRDVKPANIILCDDGSVKVADFGIARIEDSELTRTGAMMGTVSYMSPEQLTGAGLDARSDLFSCGVLLYELLTGERPFMGSGATIIQKILNQAVLPPSTLNPALPRALDPVLARALAKSPSDRFTSAVEFRRALQAAASGSGAEAREADLTLGGALRGPTDSPAQVSLPRGASAFSTTIVLPGRGPAESTRTGLFIGFGLGLLLVAALLAWRGRPQAAADGEMALAAPAPASGVAPASSAAATAAERAPAAAASAASAAHLPGPEEIEQVAWDEALKADNRGAYTAYLKAYPRGRFAALARIHLTEFPSRDRGESPGVAAAAAANAEAVARAAEAARASPHVENHAGGSRGEPPAPECEARARAGDRACQVVMAHAYRDGRGVPQDAAQALAWFRRAAESGDEGAQYQVGLAMMQGQGTPRDEAGAAAWFRRAAERGYAPAQAAVAQDLEHGDTAPRNLVLAADWYAKAASQGHAPAQAALGRLYLNGEGVFRDPAKAATLFRQAAEHGDAEGAASLGAMYERGQGVARSVEQARAWYTQALAAPSGRLPAEERDRLRAFLAAHP